MARAPRASERESPAGLPPDVRAADLLDRVELYTGDKLSPAWRRILAQLVVELLTEAR